MQTNDIKKGMRVLLRNGWEADMMDNKKGNIRMCRVYGRYTELGSVYAHDIMRVNDGTQWHAVEHTPKQLACKALNHRLFG